MKKSLDLAMRAHYDVAQDQVVLYPDKGAHPDLKSVRINIKAGTATDEKLRLAMHRKGVLPDGKLPFGNSLDSWLEMPGVRAADIQLLRQLLKSGANIAFLTSVGSAGYQLRRACANYLREEQGKAVHVVGVAPVGRYLGTSAQVESFSDSEFEPLLDEDEQLRSKFDDLKAGKSVLQEEGLSDLTETQWLHNVLPGVQHLTALPGKLIEQHFPHFTSAQVMDLYTENSFQQRLITLQPNGRYTDELKAMLRAYLVGSYEAIVYVARNEDGWVFEFDTELG